MAWSTGSFQCGTSYQYELISDDGGAGVYKRVAADGHIDYIIARIPRFQAYGGPAPTTCLREFDSEADALQAFGRWKEDPLMVHADPVSKRQQPFDARQGELSLGQLQSKDEIVWEKGVSPEEANEARTRQHGNLGNKNAAVPPSAKR
jgi:hypothetical protein